MGTFQVQEVNRGFTPMTNKRKSEGGASGEQIHQPRWLAPRQRPAEAQDRRHRSALLNERQLGYVHGSRG